MTFDTEKNKLNKLWNKVEENKNIIIRQEENNKFIIDNINDLNRTNFSLPILVNFSSDFLIPTTLVDSNDNIQGNFQEFRLIFNNVTENFIPYIHCEVVYRAGTSGVIPVTDDDIPFDEELGESNRLQKSEIFQINENSVEYIAYMRMNFFTSDPVDVEYQFICYIINPAYYQST